MVGPRRGPWRTPVLILCWPLTKTSKEGRICTSRGHFRLWRHTLSKSFGLSRTEIPVIKSFSSASLILWVMCVKTSFVDVARQNAYWLSLRRLFRCMCSTNVLLIIDSRSFLVAISRLMRQYWEWHQRSPAFLKTGNRVDTFYDPLKYLCFRQRLNSFNSFGGVTGLIISRITTRILSGHHRIWAFDKSENLMRRDRYITKSVLLEEGGSGNGCLYRQW